MPDSKDNSFSSISNGQISLRTSKDGVDSVLYLGYILPLSGAERSLLKALLLSLPDPLSTSELSKRTGISVGQISVLMNRINRKAFEIGGRKLIIGTSHHGFRLYEYA